MTSHILSSQALRYRRVRSTAASLAHHERALNGRDEHPAAALFSPRNAAVVAVLIALHVAAAWRPWSQTPDTPPKPQAVEIELARPLPMATAPKPLPPTPPQRTPAPKPVAPVAPAPAPRESVPTNTTPAPDNSTSSKAETTPAPAPAPVRSEPPPPVETQAVGKMGYQNNPAPVYPDAALERELEGTVWLRVRVLANGRAASVEVQQTSGWRVLDDAALRTVRNWLFVPASRGGTNVDGWASVPIVFKLGK
jgi:periplasmic protein TonB